MALTLQEVADALGLSYDAAHRRFALLRGPLRASVRRGTNGELLLEAGALEALRRLEALRDSGSNLREAARMVAQELGHNGNGGAQEGAKTTPSGELETLREALRDARAERDRWRAMAEGMQSELTQLRLVALAPPRPSWWSRLLGR